MSNLYVRVRTGFFTHRKTARLRLAIGDDALWIPIRLWAFAAENQPDGNLANYQSDELAMLIGCNKYATSILQALQQAGFIDPDGMIHGWLEHNGYHMAFSERGKKAAAARWAKEKPPTPPKEDIERGKRKERQALLQASPSIASSITDTSEADALAIYEAYPVKVGKPVALKAIRRAMLKLPAPQLLERTRLFAAARNGDLSFCPNPSTWFNQERFNDDPKTWKPNDNRSTSSGKVNPRTQGICRSPLTDYAGAAARKKQALDAQYRLEPEVAGPANGAQAVPAPA